jgi:hypothetical protein
MPPAADRLGLNIPRLRGRRAGGADGGARRRRLVLRARIWRAGRTLHQQAKARLDADEAGGSRHPEAGRRHRLHAGPAASGRPHRERRQSGLGESVGSGPWAARDGGDARMHAWHCICSTASAETEPRRGAELAERCANSVWSTASSTSPNSMRPATVASARPRRSLKWYLIAARAGMATPGRRSSVCSIRSRPRSAPSVGNRGRNFSVEPLARGREARFSGASGGGAVWV